jgi:hypothetical protein
LENGRRLVADRNETNRSFDRTHEKLLRGLTGHTDKTNEGTTERCTTELDVEVELITPPGKAFTIVFVLQRSDDAVRMSGERLFHFWPVALATVDRWNYGPITERENPRSSWKRGAYI